MPRRYGNALFIVIGLPAVSEKAVMRLFDKSGPFSNHDIISMSSPEDDNIIYRTNYLEILINKLADKISFKRSSDKVDPGKIILLYLNHNNWQEAVGIFDFFVCPVAVPELTEFSTKGKMLRHSPGIVVDVLKRYIGNVLSPNSVLKFYEDEIFPRYRKTPFLLPPRNFYIDRADTKLEKQFKKLRNEEIESGEFSRCLTRRNFNSEELPRFLQGRRTCEAYVDERRLVFPVAKPRS